MNATNEKDLSKIMAASTALAFAALVASLESLRPGAGGFSFQVTFRTALAFAVGAGVTLAYWRLVFKSADSERKIGLKIGTVLLALFGIVAFLYPLRFVSREKLPDILVGLAEAAIALSIVGGLLWGAHKFFSEDSHKHEE